MKTFFIALILGIFIGATITAYLDSPESFDELISSVTGRSATDTKSEAKEDVAEKTKESADKLAENIKEGTEKLLDNTKDERAEIAEKGKEILDSAKDAGIKTAIAAKLKMDSSIDASRIEIEVENGSVVLSGEISSRAEERKARDIALDTRYVKDVKSNLTIAP